MLVLARKVGESIHVGDAVTITVVQLGRGRVRLGIEAPSEIPVCRRELLERMPSPAALAKAEAN